MERRKFSREFKLDTRKNWVTEPAVAVTAGQFQCFGGFRLAFDDLRCPTRTFSGHPGRLMP
ncbi:hypothetical protein PSQ19_17315 [Devosia algicola]|uniref:Transposase DDE domain-containing protein n=1 Tax=Devosia algicola TaxID=3026418 RepID=A0ABY7YM63_9HYPH|nr:hypothetical protein [Devosia algicola]WDR02356.1 hypothetical protein PSQ19_17315 [Devosia algicola]